ncbi:hypothetical protein F5B19DRAFT_423249 [Rostrohypoxylon terebratum]|nr:hypothetical protein F5B19DRAFT_423249 [Rostrohypoxylon terebratum]
MKYGEGCPDAKLDVSGYSQGAHVMSDVLGAYSHALATFLLAGLARMLRDWCQEDDPIYAQGDGNERIMFRTSGTISMSIPGSTEDWVKSKLDVVGTSSATSSATPTVTSSSSPATKSSTTASASTNSLSTSLVPTSTPLREASSSFSTATPSATSGYQESSAGIVRCIRGCMSLTALASFIIIMV